MTKKHIDNARTASDHKTKERVKKTGEIYYVYHIREHPKTGLPYVGCTSNLRRRMSEHNVSSSQLEILWITDDIVDASIMEQWNQIRLCEKCDNRLYIDRGNDDLRQAISNTVTEVMNRPEAIQRNKDSHKGQMAWNKGTQTGPASQDSKKKNSDAQKQKRWVTDGVVMSRIDTWEELPAGWWYGRCDDPSTNFPTNIGSHRSEETRRKMSESMKGIPKKKIECEHCGKEVGTNTMHRHLPACRRRYEKAA